MEPFNTLEIAPLALILMNICHKVILNQEFVLY